MNIEKLFSSQQLETLAKARQVYGPRNQTAVAAEECIELAKELIKSCRYEDFSTAVHKTYSSVSEEVADVLIVLDHILKLYNITEEDLRHHINHKIERLGYWLDNSSSFEYTTKVRNVNQEEE